MLIYFNNLKYNTISLLKYKKLTITKTKIKSKQNHISLSQLLVGGVSLKPGGDESVRWNNRLHQKLLLQQDLALMATDTAVSKCRQRSHHVNVKTNLVKLPPEVGKTDPDLAAGSHKYCVQHMCVSVFFSVCAFQCTQNLSACSPL